MPLADLVQSAREESGCSLDLASCLLRQVGNKGRSRNLLKIYFHNSQRHPTPSASHKFGIFGYLQQKSGTARPQRSQIKWLLSSATMIKIEG